MSKKSKLYAAGAVILVLVIGAVVFYSLRNSGAGVKNASAKQSSLAQTGSNQASSIPHAGQAGNSTPGSANNPGGRSGFHGAMSNIPAGSKPFFGPIASVNGSQITIASMSRNHSPASGTSGLQAGATSTTITVNIVGDTAFNGGTKDNLTVGTRIFGYGTANSDGSINAQNIQINPQHPGGGGQFNGGQANAGQQTNPGQ